MQHKCEARVVLLSVFLVCQLVVVALYIWGGTPHSVPARFLHGQSIQRDPSAHWDADIDTVLLPTRPVDDYFVLLNDSSCFREGTDFR